MNRRILIAAIATLTLSGCSFMDSSEQPALSSEAPENWSSQQANRLAFTDWEANAKTAINHRGDSTSATLRWRQQGENYRLSFSGPFGQAGPTLSGDGHYATLEVPGEQALSAASAEELLNHKLGWQLPVGNAQYWVRGIPAPGSQHQAQFSDGQLASLKQDGWQIDYLRYHQAGQLSLPARMVLSSAELTLKLSIQRWNPL